MNRILKTKYFEKIKKFKPTFPLHPFLFSVFPILFFFSHNIKEILITKAFLPITVAVTFTTFLLLILTLIVKDKIKAALATSLFLLLFFSYGHIRNMVGDLHYVVLGFPLGTDKVLFPFWITLFLLGSYFFIRTKRNFGSLTRFLNIVSIFLVGISLLNIASFEIKTKRLVLSLPTTGQNFEVPAESTQPTEGSPDIYYLIFDRYMGHDALKETYGFDNTEFVQYLKNKGFYVATKSSANYPKTSSSLASSLNMKHLTYLTKKLGEGSADLTVLHKMIEDNEVQRFLKSRGYKYVHIGDWWGPTQKNQYADININYNNPTINETTNKLLEGTLIYPVIKKDRTWGEKTRNNHNFKFEKLADVVKIKEPKFVFAHFVLPHQPYFFDEHCNPLPESGARDHKNYLKQLKCTNQKIKTLINQILENSPKPPIIILQSDEGPFTSEEFKGGQGEKIDWRKLSDKALRSHMLILNAYYFPNKDIKDILYQSITPVNSFRVVFNLYFGAEYELLQDKSYIFEDSKHPYKFIDVTDKLRDEK